jgi:hydrogenase maturation factor
MLTQITVREYWNKISEENNSINLHIRTVCGAHRRNILKAVSL